MIEFYSAYLKYIKMCDDEGLKRTLNPLTPSNSTTINHNNKDYINFSDNDYLGLRTHSAIKDAAINATRLYGNGAGASRLVTGNHNLYKETEDKIAKWKGTEASLIMNSGFQCNVSVLATLFDKKVLGHTPLVFTDKLIHASMHQGCQLAGIKQIRFRHNDPQHLMTLLDKYKDNKEAKFILTESVFSMDGDIAPLTELYAIRDKYNACLIVDEAHAAGVFGINGRGLADKADIIIGTCGKALGSFGSYIACSQLIKDYLTQHCGGLIYSTALPPSNVAMIKTAIDLMPDLSEKRKHVLELATYFRNKLYELGYNCGQSETQIVPLIMQDTDKTIQLSNYLKENGFWATPIRPPTVPTGTNRIRFSFSASHTKDDIEKLIQAIKNYTDGGAT